ncbi:carbohydrate ABC transporter permease [Paenibacillus hamazuiensis]|uniref:carbohydrate ABC transporter permease n=1 Tax=Paenibacillus hamazuiensis TaxID=2936508 RepID=UPI00200D1BD1|nr:carbohydrate ABC transporter permease [Paenibacillus hamazuiensis]
MKQTAFTDKLVIVFAYTILSLLGLSSLLPLMQVITLSMSPSEVINSYSFHFIPLKFDFKGYATVLANENLWRAYGNTLLRTALGVSLTIVLTFCAAYPLTKKDLPHRTFWTAFVVLTMFFSGGLIPLYLLIKSLGLMDSIWALVLPPAINTFMVMVVRNFIAELPESLEESAKIDGANDIVILFRIVIPLSLPIIATVGLYSGVYHWNAWFDSMIYIQDGKKHVLQFVLRKIILLGNTAEFEMTGQNQNVTDVESIKMATLVVSIIPLLLVYPFLQKYFVKGSLMGAVKG